MLTYTIQFAVMLSLCTNLVQFYARAGSAKTGSHVRRYGAAYLMLVATLLLLVSPLKNLMVNICMQSFQDHGYEESIGVILDVTTSQNMNSAVMQKLTMLGYAFLTAGTLQSLACQG